MLRHAFRQSLRVRLNNSLFLRRNHALLRTYVSKIMDGNEATTRIAYKMSDNFFIYPITPSSPMAEMADVLSLKGEKNIFGHKVEIFQMQSEAGAVGSMHGALLAGSRSTTFTSSQGLVLMIPNLFQFAYGLLPGVIHVASRTVAGSGTTIGGDHMDVMATRVTGISILSSHSPQEAHDLALAAHVASYKARYPILHFFDGFQVSHQLSNVELIDEDVIKKMAPYDSYVEHQRLAVNPHHPKRFGPSVTGDIYMQMMESTNPYVNKLPQILEDTFAEIKKYTGREYHIFDYIGAKDAEKVIVIMGGSALSVEEVVDHMIKKGEKVGVIKVHLYRPWSAEYFLKALPQTVKKIAVLDRTKEGGSFGEPLYLDVVSTIQNAGRNVTVIGGRYGISGKAFNPPMIKAVFDNLDKEKPVNGFTVGIEDDVTFKSLPVGTYESTIPEGTKQCVFWALGADGTIGANKNALKIIGEKKQSKCQAYFYYSSHKSGGTTLSHLRFGTEKLKSHYPVIEADYVACHNPVFVNQFNVLANAKENSIFVLNSPWTTVEELDKHLPGSMKRILARKNIQFYNVDAHKISKEIGLGGHINMVMQIVFFKLSNFFSEEESKQLLKDSVREAYATKGEKVIEMNCQAIDRGLEGLQKIQVPPEWKDAELEKEEPLPDDPAADFIQKIQRPFTKRLGNKIPVSHFVPGGSTPTGTAQYEKRGIALEVPSWNPDKCIQCNICSIVCPHGVIRPFIATKEEKENAPSGMKFKKLEGKKKDHLYYTLQISPMHCTGCMECFESCGPSALEMKPLNEVVDEAQKYWDYAMTLKNEGWEERRPTVKGTQFQQPLLEFSGACASCGQTPYVKLLTQLFGPRMLITNTTGCSSVWGGFYPSSPWRTNKDGLGPSFSRSLFENNAEFGYGMAMGYQQRRKFLLNEVQKLLALPDAPISSELRSYLQNWATNYDDAKLSVETAVKVVPMIEKEYPNAQEALEAVYTLRDMFIKESQWIIGGDGWAYDIGYGGLDHVLSTGKKVNILVMDNEEYANTGGQQSKATQIGASTKFALGGKSTIKKDLGMIAMTYQNVYVASVSLGNLSHLVSTLQEAESYEGTSLVIAYCPCRDHGSDLGMIKDSKLALDTGYWLLYRYDPRLKKQGKNPFQLDTPLIRKDVNELLENQDRFRSLLITNPGKAKELHDGLKKYIQERYESFKKLAGKS